MVLALAGGIVVSGVLKGWALGHRHHAMRGDVEVNLVTFIPERWLILAPAAAVGPPGI